MTSGMNFKNNPEAMAMSFSERHAMYPFYKIHLKTFAKNTSAMLGLAIVLCFLTIAAIGPWIVPFPRGRGR